MSGVTAWNRRHASARRLEPLDCGRHSDPWVCDCVTSRYSVDSYAAAARHLLAGGLTPAPDVEALRVLWRRSQADRDLVQAISALWEVAS
jgi:hypothetical protein